MCLMSVPCGILHGGSDPRCGSLAPRRPVGRFCGIIVPTRSVQCREVGVPGDPRQAAACRSAPVPVAFSTFFTSLRMPKPEMTSITPRTISQIPTTSANVTIESNG